MVGGFMATVMQELVMGKKVAKPKPVRGHDCARDGHEYPRFFLGEGNVCIRCGDRKPLPLA